MRSIPDRKEKFNRLLTGCMTDMLNTHKISLVWIASSFLKLLESPQSPFRSPIFISACPFFKSAFFLFFPLCYPLSFQLSHPLSTSLHPLFFSLITNPNDSQSSQRGADGSGRLSLYLDLIKDHYNLSAQWGPGCDRVGGKGIEEGGRV